MTHAPTRLFRALAALALVLVAGCDAAGGPAGPVADRCPTARAPFCTDTEHAALVRAAVADAATRLVPALEDASARDALAERLAVLSVALDAGEVGHGRSVLADLRTVIAGARAASHATDAADLEAIANTLQETADALAGS